MITVISRAAKLQPSPCGGRVCDIYQYPHIDEIALFGSRSSGASGVGLHIARLRWGLATLIAIGLMGCAFSARAQSVRPLAEFTVDGTGDAIMVPVKIDSQDHLFLVDTGSSSSIIDVSLQKLPSHAAESRQVKTFAEPANVKFVRAPKAMCVGPIPFASDAAVAVADLRDLRRATGHQIYGIIGMDFLERYVLELNPDAERLAVYKGMPAVSAVPVVMPISQHTPRAKAIIDGSYQQDFSLDTGYYADGSAGLSRGSFERLLSTGRIKPESQPAHLATASGDILLNRLARVESVSIGEVTAFDVNISESGSDVLGLTFFSRFRAIFDFPNERLYLAPAHRVLESDQRDRSGLHLWRIGDKIIVRSVDPRSPGAKASVRPSDELLKVNGTPTSQVTLHKIRCLLRRVDTGVPLRVRRKHEEFDVTIHL